MHVSVPQKYQKDSGSFEELRNTIPLAGPGLLWLGLISNEFSRSSLSSVLAMV